MSENDLELYIRARNPLSYGNILMATASLSLGVAFIVAFVPALSGYTKYFLLTCFILGASSYGIGRYCYVSKSDLLNLIERQINSDADALAYLSTRKLSGAMRPSKSDHHI